LCNKLHRYTALHVAVEENHIEVVRLLISVGADLTTLDRHGQTPEAIAVAGGHHDVAQLLHDAT